jgi:site-specific DNA-methyltransferase (adenine-specific)
MRKAGAGGDPRLKNLRLNVPQQMNGVDLFEQLPDKVAALVIADPQYRTGLDKLKFGNEGARQIGRAALPQQSDSDIIFMVQEAARVLRPSGLLMLWCDKFAIGSGQHLRYLRRAPALQVVDLLAWNKMAIGMGRRLRCMTEYLVIAQKLPVRAKGLWTDHRIPDCWPEAKNSPRHPHAKPYRLTEALIRATTKRGDLVVDPAAGGYGTLEACQASGRDFVGCDLIAVDDPIDSGLEKRTARRR